MKKKSFIRNSRKPATIALNVTSGGLRYDDGKIPMELLSPIAMEGTAIVLHFGAVKYELRNWEKGMHWSKVIAPLLRHVFAFMRGEDNDSETGLPHVHHIGCNAMFLQHYFELKLGTDDRAKYAPTNLADKYKKQFVAFANKWRASKR